MAQELLTPQRQNEVVSKYDRPLHEVMSIVSEKTPLRFSMLIDYFKKTYNIILKPENQLFFNGLVFSFAFSGSP